MQCVIGGLKSLKLIVIISVVDYLRLVFNANLICCILTIKKPSISSNFLFFFNYSNVFFNLWSLQILPQCLWLATGHICHFWSFQFKISTSFDGHGGKGETGERFSMLGLGDIVMPGLLLCFVLRYDNYKKRKSQQEANPLPSHPGNLIYRMRYFHCTLIGYFVGL